MSGEIWRPVPGFESSHEVSSFGNVRTLTREIRNRGRRQIRRGQPLRPRQDTCGYLQFQFHVCGHRVALSAGRLVAGVFIGPPPTENAQVNHRDGNPKNNHVQNLEWVTPAENCQHARDTGLRVAPRGERHGMAKVSDFDVVWIKAWLRSGFRAPEIARAFSINKSTVYSIKYGKCWASIDLDVWLEVARG